MLICLHNHNPGHDKFYAVRVDKIGNEFAVVASYGKAAAPRAQAQQEKARFSSYHVARQEAERLAREKTNGGYENIEDSAYRGNLTVVGIRAKIDTSRLYDPDSHGPYPVSYEIPTTPEMRRAMGLAAMMPMAAARTSKRPAQQRPAPAGPARATRSLRI